MEVNQSKLTLAGQ